VSPAALAEGRVIEELLAGFAPAEFFANVWQRRSLHVRGEARRFAHLFDADALRRAAPACERVKVGTSDARGWPAEAPLAAARIDEAFAAGATVCLQVITGVPALDELRARFARELLQAGEPCFNCYWSPDGKGFALHLDDHPVFVLQVSGRKRWRYSKTPGLAQPLSTVSFPPGVPFVRLPWGVVQRPDESGFAEAVLEPGDVLYLPQGTWHAAAAVGESLALTLAFDRATPLDLVQRAVGAFVAAHPELRHNLPGFPAGGVAPDAPPAELGEALASALASLQGLVAGLRVEDLYRLWREDAARHGRQEQAR